MFFLQESFEALKYCNLQDTCRVDLSVHKVGVSNALKVPNINSTLPTNSAI